MRELLVATAALGAGSTCGAAVIVLGDLLPVAGLGRALNRARIAQTWFQQSIGLAGWTGGVVRVAAVWLAIGGGAALVAAMIGIALVPVSLVAAAALFLIALNSAIEKRRRRLAGELVPLLELFTLELSGGGSALSALGSVSVQVQSELAADIRRMLIASQMAGSASFEARLIEYSERAGIPALGSLATVLVASREFGTGASQGVRALATDLRRAQRRELIAHSRRALNHVLLPAALTVLLPFLGVLMFPAVSVLERSLR